LTDSPITPKTNKRVEDDPKKVVLDGEIVGESEHSFFSQSTQSNSQKDQQSNQSSTIQKPFHWKSFINLSFLALFVATLALIFALKSFNTGDDDRQTERLNQLQSKLLQVMEQNAHLSEQVTSQQATLQKLEEDITQVSLTADRSVKWISKEELQTGLDSLESNVQTQLQKWQSVLSGLASPTNDSPSPAQENESLATEDSEVSPTDTSPTESVQSVLEQFATQAQIESIDQAWKQGVSELKTVLDRLALRNEYLVENQEVLNDKTMGNMKALTPMQLSQWVVAVNTQWLLVGEKDQTRERLLSLEQAIVISEQDYAPKLLRLLGEDLAMLERAPNDKNLQKTLQTLTDAFIRLKGKESPGSSEAKSDQSKADKPEQSIHDLSMQSETTQSASDKLWDKMASMFVVRKRSSEAEVTEVERLLLADVLQQRGLLLIERISWAEQTQSQTLLTDSVIDFEAYLAEIYPTQKQALETELTLLKQHQFEQRQNLKLMNFMGVK